MEQLTGVFLDVDTGYADALGIAFLVHDDVQMTMLAQRNIILGNLIGLGQVRIEVVLTVLLADIVDLAAQSMTHADGIVNNLLIQYRQRTGHTGADRAAVGVYFRAEGVLAAAVNLGLCIQFGMDFQANDDLIIHCVVLL